MSATRDFTVVGTSAAVAAGGRIRVHVAGEELVLWRDMGGTAHLFSNRCPHRGMRLSFGFVRGDTLACPYHGWRYGPDGRCRAIPAHPELEPPATIRVDAWTVVERAGLLLGFNPGRPALVPDLPDEFRACRSIYADGPVERLRVALLDHLPADWRLTSGAVDEIDGETDAGSAFRALVAVEAPVDGLAAAHVSIRSADEAAPIYLAGWLAERRDGLEEGIQ